MCFLILLWRGNVRCLKVLSSWMKSSALWLHEGDRQIASVHFSYLKRPKAASNWELRIRQTVTKWPLATPPVGFHPLVLAHNLSMLWAAMQIRSQGWGTLCPLCPPTCGGEGVKKRGAGGEVLLTRDTHRSIGTRMCISPHTQLSEQVAVTVLWLFSQLGAQSPQHPSQWASNSTKQD